MLPKFSIRFKCILMDGAHGIRHWPKQIAVIQTFVDLSGNRPLEQGHLYRSVAASSTHVYPGAGRPHGKRSSELGR